MQTVFTVEFFDEDNISVKQIVELIKKHENSINSLDKNLKYYNGDHSILRRSKRDINSPNNKIVCNHAKDIADTATGYFLSSALTYSTNDEGTGIDVLIDAFDEANVDEVDHDNALDMSRLGVAYEYVYAKQDEAKLTIKNLNPKNTFIVYDDTIEMNELFGIYYFKTKQDNDYVYNITLATKSYVYTFKVKSNTDSAVLAPTVIAHHLGAVPIIEYKNNKDCFGDYEQQIGLIDAYNTLMSDRVNDKEQFINSILVIYGAVLGDDIAETSEAVKVLNEKGLLELPDSTKAEYLTRTFDENGMEVLKKAIKQDIYNFSHVPNLSDENFVGNSSGVAMEYKLLGLEMITKTKERYYTKGLKKRMQLFAFYHNIKAIAINPTLIIPTFKRGLPKNVLELSQMISNLSGFVSTKTLISQLDFIEDPEGEIKKVAEEKKQSLEVYNINDNEPYKDENTTATNSGSE